MVPYLCKTRPSVLSFLCINIMIYFIVFVTTYLHKTLPPAVFFFIYLYFFSWQRSHKFTFPAPLCDHCLFIYYYFLFSCHAYFVLFYISVSSSSILFINNILWHALLINQTRLIKGVLGWLKYFGITFVWFYDVEK